MKGGMKLKGYQVRSNGQSKEKSCKKTKTRQERRMQGNKLDGNKLKRKQKKRKEAKTKGDNVTEKGGGGERGIERKDKEGGKHEEQKQVNRS